MSEDMPLPKLAWDPSTESFTSNQARKRVRLSSPVQSSDPAVFSSDDDPSADNYNQEHRKRRYRGPWYRQRPASDAGSQDTSESVQKKSKRTFERQFDSGVFLGSDCTDASDILDEVETEIPPLPLRQSRVIFPAVKKAPSPEDLAQEQIQHCLEVGDESIDLSSRGLTTLSNATIRPLAAFACIPPLTEGVFSRLEPRLKLFLSSNNLSSLPGELFNLHHLTVLSLRGNQIHELPPSVGRLSNLKELNLAQNGLRYLPFEILDLFLSTSRLNSLNLYPNLFHEPKFPPNLDNENEHEVFRYKIGLGNRGRSLRQSTPHLPSSDRIQRSWHSQWKLIYQGRTEISYLDINGCLLKGPKISSNDADSPPISIPVANTHDTPEPPTSRGTESSRAPSLLESALKGCIKHPQSQFLASYLPEDSPSYLAGVLEQALVKRESGGSKCTVCGRSFIIARTEWIEWWSISKVLDQDGGAASAASPLRQMENERDVSESMVPLIRRGCNWLCAPEKSSAVLPGAAYTEVMN